MKMKKRLVCFVLQALFLFACMTGAQAADQQKLYDGAVKLMEEDCYEEARAVLDMLGDYQDSQTLLAECRQHISSTASAQTGTDTMNITVQATLVDANHVGNEWTLSFYVNDELLTLTKKNKGTFEITSAEVSVSKGSTMQLKCCILEIDKYPDTGKEQAELPVTDDLLQNGTSMTWKIKVKENGGRYSGNEAEWRVDVTLSPSK